MIIQSAPENSPSLVIPMTDHLSLADQFAEGFGNEEFKGFSPEALMRFAVANHDKGWEEIDKGLALDPDTGLPANLLKTPLDDLLRTGTLSADYNEAHHPWCGLLISMHVYGLYHGRYGLSDKIVVEGLPEAVRPKFDSMLEAEVERQNRLKSELTNDPEMAEFVEEATLFHYYKILQFFDTLALYFCMEHAGNRGEASFFNVPQSVGNDVTVSITPAGESTYRLAPFPFKGDALEVKLPGHFMSPQPVDTDIQKALSNTAKSLETLTLIR